MNNPGRVLLIRPSALGDVCRSVPVLVGLRRLYPSARIDWLVQDSFAEAVSEHPALRSASGGGVIPFARKRLGQLHVPTVWGELVSFVRGLRSARYDLVVDAQGLLRSALFTRATRAPVRVGFVNAQEGGAFAYNIKVHAERSLHAVERMMRLLEPLATRAGVGAGAEAGVWAGVGVGVGAFDMSLYVPTAARAWAEARPELRGRYVVLAPSSRWASKRWPAGSHARVAAGLLAGGMCERVVLVGGRGEEDQCGPLLELAGSDARIVNLMGKTSVGQLMAVLERGALLLGSDSAAVHMAVGLKRPLVALYGPTDAARVGPFGRLGDVLQHVEPGEALDHKRDEPGATQMARISVDEVLRACRGRL